jgi:3-phenylpropionate/trans-cinnamate dioxygenase ferredoxin subunit
MVATYNYRQVNPDRLEFVTVAKTSELGEGQRLFLDVGGDAIAVFQIAGRYFAIGDVCSHDDGPVGEGVLQGTEIECPRHGAHFNLETGKALSLPAVVDIPAYPVRVVEDEIQVGFPAE